VYAPALPVTPSPVERGGVLLPQVGARQMAKAMPGYVLSGSGMSPVKSALSPTERVSTHAATTVDWRGGRRSRQMKPNDIMRIQLRRLFSLAHSDRDVTLRT